MKLLKILLEQEKILVPRRSKEERAKNYKIVINRQIQQYIKDGSKGNLALGGKHITSLPDNLKYVGGNLTLSNNPIKSLPDNLKVKGTLWLQGSTIESLPDNLEVVGDLWIKNTPLSDKYSDTEIKTLANIKGSIIRR